MSKKFLVFLLVILLGLFSLSFAQTTSRFKDVPPTHWAAKAVNYLVELGIIAGIRPDTFGGDMYVTRYQVAVLLYNLIEKLKLTEITLPAKDIAELKNLVKELSEELTLLGSRVDDLMAVLDDLSSKVDDIEARLGEVETAITERPTLEDVEAVIEEKLAEIEAPDISELEGRVSDLESLASDIDSRLSDVEVLLVDRPTFDEVTALIEEKLAEIEIPDVEELKATLEEHSDAIDALRADVDVILVEELPVVKDDVATLQDQVSELDSKVADLEAVVAEKVTADDVSAMIEESLGDVIATLDDLSVRMADVEGLAGDLDSRVGDVEGRVEELETKVSDLFAQVLEMEKVEVTEEQIKAVIGEKLEETIEKVTKEVMEELIGKVSDLEDLVVSIDNRVSDLEVAITEKASLDDVSAMLEEGLGDLTARVDTLETTASDLDLRVGDVEFAVSDVMAITDDLTSQVIALSERVDALETGVAVEELAGRLDDLEALVGDMDSRLSDVEVALTEKASLEELEALQAQIDEINERLSILEVPAGLEELVGRLEAIEISVEDLYSKTDDLSIGLTEVSDRVSNVEDAVAGVSDKVSALEKSVGKFAVSGSTSVTVKKEFGANKNIAISESTTVNLSFKPADGVNVSAKLYSVDGKFSLNRFDVSVAQVEFGLKNLLLSYVPGASGNFAVDVNGLVGSKTAKFVASVDLPQGFKVALGLDGTDGTGADLVVGKVSGSVSNVDINVFGMVGRTVTTSPYKYTIGGDFGTSVAEGIKLFGEAVYDGTFDVLGGVSLIDVGVKGLSSTLKATYKDNSLTLSGSASYQVVPEAKVGLEVTVSNVTQTPSYTVKGSVSGTVAPFSYEAYFVYPSYETWAKVSGKVNPRTYLETAFFAPNITNFGLDTVSLVVKGAYNLTDKVTLWAWATNNQDGKWFTDQGMSTYPGTATAMAGIDYAITSNVTANLSVYKLGLGNIPQNPLPTDVTLKVSVGF